MSRELKSVSVVFQAFTDKFEKKVDSTADKLGGFAKKVIGLGATYLAAKASIGSFTSQFEKLDRLGKLSDALQVSPDFLRGLELAADRMGESFEGAQDLIKEFNIRMGEARVGAGPALDALKILGMGIEDFRNMSPEDSFLAVADALSKIEDPQLKIFAAGDIFGGKGEDMLHILNKGKDGLEEFIQKSKELQGPITREDIDKITQANNAIDDMSKSWDSVIQELSIELAPVLRDVANIMKDMAKIAGDIARKYSDMTDTLADYMLIANNALFGGISDEELQYALTLDTTERPQPRQSTQTARLPQQEVKAKISNIQTFVESLSAGSAAAFKALNPNQKVDTQREMVTEQKKTNTLLDEMIDSLPNFDNIKTVELR